MEELRRVFDKADTDKSGTLDFEELQASIGTVRSLLHLESDQITEIFNKVDRNRSGQIEFSEFCQAALDQDFLLQEDNLSQAFKALDRDNSGGISKTELLEVFGECESDASHIDQGVWAKIQERVGLNEDGELQYQEFKDYMKMLVHEEAKRISDYRVSEEEKIAEINQ